MISWIGSIPELDGKRLAQRFYIGKNQNGDCWMIDIGGNPCWKLIKWLLFSPPKSKSMISYLFWQVPKPQANAKTSAVVRSSGSNSSCTFIPCGCSYCAVNVDNIIRLIIPEKRLMNWWDSSSVGLSN